VVRLVVTDSTGLSSDQKSFTLTALQCGATNPAVIATALPATTNPNAQVNLNANVTDADNNCGANQTFTVQWTDRSQPDGSSAAFSNSLVTNPTFTADKAGAYELGVVATDSTGLSSAIAVVTVTVNNCGEAPPTVDSIAATSGVGGNPPTGTVGTGITLNAVVSSLNCLAT